MSGTASRLRVAMKLMNCFRLKFDQLSRIFVFWGKPKNMSLISSASTLRFEDPWRGSGLIPFCSSLIELPLRCGEA